MADERQALTSKTGFEVTIVTPAGSATRVVDGDSLTVGRAESSNLVIQHETLSRRHLVVRRRGDVILVEDLGSSNGSFVNGQRLRPNVPTELKPQDVITMGEATVQLNVGIPRPAAQSAAPPSPAAPESTQTRTLAPVLAPVPAAERALAEAQRQAAQILARAEVEAEARAQEILRRAHESEASVNERYQRRLNEAFLSSDQMTADAERNARDLIEVARQQATEIRAQADQFGADLRARTKVECERALEDAHQTARELRERKLEELAETERARREDAHQNLKADLDAFEQSARRSFAEDESRRRADLDALLEVTQARHRELCAEIETLAQRTTEERQSLEILRADLARDRAEVDALLETRANADREVRSMTERAGVLDRLREQNETLIRDQRGALAALDEDHARAVALNEQNRVDAEAEAARFKDRILAERAAAEAEEARYLEDAKLETIRRARDIEVRMMEELIEKRESLARELALNVDAYLKQFGADSAGLEAEVRAVFDRQISAIAEDDSNRRRQTSLAALRRRQKWVSGLVGAALSAAATFGGLHLWATLTGEISPMQRRLAAAEESRARDLEQRRFNPEQTPGYKTSYFENVVYGLNFVDTYASEAFQARLRQEMMPYMLRVWRLDENKVIETLAIAEALVKALAEKRRLVHPDTLQKNLDAMKEAETEASARMRDALGSRVRLESYLKFEREFYDRYRP